MKSLFKLVKLLFLLFFLLSLVLVYRTFQFQATEVNYDKLNLISMDYEAAVARFVRALQLKTISFQNSEDRDVEAFLEFQQLLVDSFPAVHKKLKRTKINQLSLLYHWRAKSPQNLKPILLMAHYDVVPVNPATLDEWQHPPFAGVVENNVIWGRGALDDKSAVMSLMEAIEALLNAGFQPSRDIYLVFGHDEEVGGLEGAAKAADYLKKQGVEFEFVLDEGGFLTQGLVKGIDQPVGLIGVAEKGYLSLELSTHSNGGHSSVPPKSTSIGRLSRAVVAIENNPFQPRLVLATRGLLLSIGQQMPFAKRLVMANLWLFEPFVLAQMSQSPLTNASIRTTQAVTMFHGGEKENALPTETKAVVNLRLLPGDNIEYATNHVIHSVADKEVQIKPLKGVAATQISDIDSAVFHRLAKTLIQVSPEADILVAPNLLVGGTDSKHFVSLAENVYRLNGVKINPESFSGFHGINEHLSVENYQRSINFYYQLIKQLDKE